MDSTERLIVAVNRLADMVEQLADQSRPRTVPFTKIVYNTWAMKSACGGLPNPSPHAVRRLAENL